MSAYGDLVTSVTLQPGYKPYRPDMRRGFPDEPTWIDKILDRIAEKNKP